MLLGSSPEKKPKNNIGPFVFLKQIKASKRRFINIFRLEYDVFEELALWYQKNAQPGEKMVVIPYENRIEFLPVRNIKDMRGFLKGIDTTIERDKDGL